MNKISDAVSEVVEGNPFLLFGFSRGLMNLTQLAHFIQPMIQLRTKKEIQISALVMNLSRMQRTFKKIVPKTEEFYVDTLTVHSHLSLYTFQNTFETNKEINNLYNKVHEKNAYVGITRGTHEIMLIIESSFDELVEKTVAKGFKNKRSPLSAIGMTFDEKYEEVPGFLYIVFQQMILQNITVIETASTYTEIILYVDEKDTKLAFETLYTAFHKS